VVLWNPGNYLFVLRCEHFDGEEMEVYLKWYESIMRGDVLSPWLEICCNAS